MVGYHLLIYQFLLQTVLIEDQTVQNRKFYRKHISMLFNPFPNDKILDLSKLKEFADDNFQFDENDVKFSKKIINIVGKGGIAHYEQFLLFPQCFPKTCTVDT